MPSSEQVIDTLWHCLCPTFSRIAQSPKPRIQRIRPQYALSSSTSRCLQTRLNSTLVEQRHTSASRIPTVEEALAWNPVRVFHNAQAYGSREFDDASQNRIRRRLLNQGRGKSIEDVYVLLDGAAENADPFATESYARFLIEMRGERPNARIYAALLRACAHHEFGSVSEIERLLKEMDHNGIIFDSQIYASAFKALACHPSYALREDLLRRMEEREIALSSAGWHYLCCAQIREKQIELALETLNQMTTKLLIQPRAWLLDVLCHTLAEIGEFEVLADLVSERLKMNLRPHGVLWHQILSRAAENLHYPVVVSAWQTVVRFNHFTPSTGLCTLVLNTAARAGDETLAMDVLRVLGNRSSSIEPHHYEALLEACFNAQEVEIGKILAYLSVMELSSPRSVTYSLTRSLFACLKQDSVKLELCVSALDDMKEKNMLIPVAVLDTVFEAIIYHSGLVAALDFYTELHKYSESGSDNPAKLSTYNVLLKGCSEAKQKSDAMFLAAEMVAQRVKPDQSTYDRLIVACLNGNEGDSILDAKVHLRHLDDGMLYFKEMIAQQHYTSEATVIALAEAAARIADERFDEVLDYMSQQGMDTRGVKRYRAELQRGRDL